MNIGENAANLWQGVMCMSTHKLNTPLDMNHLSREKNVSKKKLWKI